MTSNISFPSKDSVIKIGCVHTGPRCILYGSNPFFFLYFSYIVALVLDANASTLLDSGCPGVEALSSLKFTPARTSLFSYS